MTILSFIRASESNVEISSELILTPFTRKLLLPLLVVPASTMSIGLSLVVVFESLFISNQERKTLYVMFELFTNLFTTMQTWILILGGTPPTKG